MSIGRGCAGAVGVLLTLACGSKVEIGHGGRGGTSSMGDGGDVSTATAGAAAETGGTTGDGGEPAEVGGTVTGGSGGNAGMGASTTVGSPPPADNGPQARASKVDLLLAIDNSISMSDKQAILAKSLPLLLTRLVNPPCVNSTGDSVVQPTSPDAACPENSHREFEPLRDLHVGVITSSLGSHGASGNGAICAEPLDDDHAHLLPDVRSGLSSYNNEGYLNWDPDGSSSPPGESDVQAFAQSVTETINAVGEQGCGYEAQLESVYRFLVDPDPPASVERDGGTRAKKVGTDRALLQQRERFLRPDSSVVVLMLTDENDCSILDEGYGWLIPNGTGSMFRSTSFCATDPNNTCCQSCGETTAHEGCPPIPTDPACQKGTTLPRAEDDPNLRCYRQKERFGFDLLYPTARYASGFGDGNVPDRDGNLVPNPLFHRNGITRDRSLFTLAVVAGVPWQDIVTPDSLSGDSLRFMTAQELTSNKRWPVILGNPDRFVEPSDPFMRESTGDRTGKNPIIDAAIVPSSSQDPTANPINGHEQITMASDLQYACTFPLLAPKICDQQAMLDGHGCDCFADDLPFNRPLCNPPGGGPATTTQHYGKAYPALRELSVVQQLGRRSVLGSICAANTQDTRREDYGYGPLVNALGNRLATTLVKP